MLYNLLLFPARLFIHFYFRKIIISNRSVLQKQGPLLIASNHPNSFLDAIVVASLFKNSVYSLARGDAFNGRLITKILISFNMLPVYRVSEGVENLEHNYATFDACQNIFKKNGIVLIFSEGRCVNEWHLRPIKKGTARLALEAWQQDVMLEVLPLGINYSNFRKPWKNLVLNFGTVITKEDIRSGFSSGKAINEFNEILKQQLQSLVFEIDEANQESFNEYFYLRNSLTKKILLSLPAAAGYILHFPLYYLIHLSIKNKAKDHYDSIMFGLLFFIYPLYVLIFILITFFITNNPIAFFLLIILPACALSLLHYKKS